VACPAESGTDPYCGIWGFEDGTDQGWTYQYLTGKAPATSDATTIAPFSGSYSLGTTMTSSLSGELELTEDLCGLVCTGGICNNAPVTFSQLRNLKASILMGDSNGNASPMPSACSTSGSCTVTVGWYNADFQQSTATPQPIQWGDWFTIDLRMNVNIITRVYLKFSVPTAANWNGTIYVDDVSIH
jgi:hypothetical protein